ncbi:MAG: hypothetical protein ACRDTH_21905 [Pseudonocardiaceae bacterium]
MEQVYLGTEEEVVARLTAGPGGDPSLPETEHRGFGDVAAVWGMLARLDAIAVIEESRVFRTAVLVAISCYVLSVQVLVVGLAWGLVVES